MRSRERVVSEAMNRAGVRFGTSGARGRVEALAAPLCYALTAAFAGHLEAQGFPIRRVALAGDRRASTPAIMAACARALRDREVEVVDCGLVPTPALACHAMAEGIGAVMVTGSHIPDDRNGIKLYTPHGEILKADERAIAARAVAIPEPFGECPPLVAPTDAAARRYVARFVDAFGARALAGLRVGAYGHSAVGRGLTVEILQRLGARVVRLGDSERFVAVDTEAVRPEDHALAHGWAREHALDAIVTTDGDGDRPMIADATGRWLRGDVVGVLAAKALGAQIVYTPVSSSTVVERCGWFDAVVRTRIGSPYIVEAMGQGADGIAMGYEANGGLLQHSPVALPHGLLSALPTRDAVVVLVAVLQAAAAQGLTVAELVAALPPRFTASDRVVGVEGDRSRAWMREALAAGVLATTVAPDLGMPEAIDTTDGVRMTFSGGDIVHVRPSGNAPELRCYSEADSAARAEALVAGALRRLSVALAGMT